MTKVVVDVFDTDFTSKRYNTKIENGKITIADKEWVVDGVRPFATTAAFGTVRPLYLLKWNSMTPLEFSVEESDKSFTDDTSGQTHKFVHKELVPLTQDPKKGLGFAQSKILPQTMKLTTDMRFLRSLRLGAKPKSKMDFNEMLPYIIAIGGAIFIMMILSQTGLLDGIVKALGLQAFFGG